MDATNLLLFTVGLIAGGGLTGVIMASRAFNRQNKRDVAADEARRGVIRAA